MLLKEDTYLIFHIDARGRCQESEKDNIIINLIIILENGFQKNEFLA